LASPDRVTRLDPIFGPMSIDAGSRIWAPSLLSMREKSVLLIAGDVTVRELGLPFELHIEMALTKAGLSVEDIRELLRHVAPAAGLNPSARAFERLVEVVTGLGFEPRSSVQRGRAPHPAPYPTHAVAELRAA